MRPRSLLSAALLASCAAPPPPVVSIALTGNSAKPGRAHPNHPDFAVIFLQID